MTFKPKDPVIYAPPSTGGDPSHPAAEHGYITAITGDVAWCRFYYPATRILRTRGEGVPVLIEHLLPRRGWHVAPPLQQSRPDLTHVT